MESLVFGISGDLFAIFSKPNVSRVLVADPRTALLWLGDLLGAGARFLARATPRLQVGRLHPHMGHCLFT